MKENRYDDEEFFSSYSHMERSEKGLQGAAEWPELRDHLPDFTGKRVLDLGCGYGWHAAYAADHGAEHVLATDISRRMLERAEEANSRPGVIEYRNIAMEDLDQVTAPAVRNRIHIQRRDETSEFVEFRRFLRSPAMGGGGALALTAHVCSPVNLIIRASLINSAEISDFKRSGGKTIAFLQKYFQTQPP